MTRSGAISLMLVLAYLAVSLAYRGKPTVEIAALAIVSVVALAFIWFPDAFGNYTGGWGRSAITEPTPPFMIAAVGWLILLAIPVLWYLHVQSNAQAIPP